MESLSSTTEYHSTPLAIRTAGAGTPDLERASWLAACVRSRHEKKVAQQLERSALECFLPLYQAVHRWKNRKAVVSLPLFPGYIFTRVVPRERRRILTTPGVVKLVSFQGQPAVIPESEIESLRLLLSKSAHMEPHPYLTVGRRVRITHGPFIGTEGILLRRKGRLRFVLSVHLVARSVAVEVDICDLSPIPESHRQTAAGNC